MIRQRIYSHGSVREYPWLHVCPGIYTRLQSVPRSGGCASSGCPLQWAKPTGQPQPAPTSSRSDDHWDYALAAPARFSVTLAFLFPLNVTRSRWVRSIVGPSADLLILPDHRTIRDQPIRWLRWLLIIMIHSFSYGFFFFSLKNCSACIWLVADWSKGFGTIRVKNYQFFVIFFARSFSLSFYSFDECKRRKPKYLCVMYSVDEFILVVFEGSIGCKLIQYILKLVETEYGIFHSPLSKSTFYSPVLILSFIIKILNKRLFKK